MRNLLIALTLILSATTAHAAMAIWTGRMEYVTTVTYRQAVSCEYNINGQRFWRTFTTGYCPSSVEVY